jgi:hypothetical protein
MNIIIKELKTKIDKLFSSENYIQAIYNWDIIYISNNRISINNMFKSS